MLLMTFARDDRPQAAEAETYLLGRGGEACARTQMSFPPRENCSPLETGMIEHRQTNGNKPSHKHSRQCRLLTDALR